MANAKPLERGDWARTFGVVPIFGSSDLLEIGVLHSSDCPAGLDSEGHVRSKRCSCGSSRRTLPKKSPGQIAEVLGASALIALPKKAPCWVEVQTLKPCGRPDYVDIEEVYRSPLKKPMDWMVLEDLLKRGAVKYPRRRRMPRSGEIVFVRDELREQRKDIEIRRLFCRIQREGTPMAVLLDGDLSIDQALSPKWEQRHEVPMVRDGKLITLAQLLVPAFPLPDGTEDPGWVFTD